MSTLSTKDKDTVKAHKVPGKEELIDADALATILAVYPQAKRFVSHFEVSPGSEQMKEHGKPIVTGVGEAVANIDDLTPGLLNFKILSHILLVVLARTFPKEFAPEVHVCTDKFLARVSYALSEKPQAEASVVSAQ